MGNVIVTGGSRGIGLGIAHRLAGDGYDVVAVARQPSEQLEAAMTAVRRDSTGSLRFVAADLSDIAAVPILANTLRKELRTIYGLVNNAGIGTPGVLATMPDGDIERLIRLNVASPILLTKYLVRSMMARGEGRIVNLSSIVGMTGYKGLAAYSATKSAMVGFTRSLAREVGGLGITVNAVAPGFINTEMTGELNDGHREKIARRSALHRMAEVDDIAAAVAYLLSDGARNVTGTVLTVDAGATA